MSSIIFMMPGRLNFGKTKDFENYAFEIEE